jgi:hypothetical protein
MRTVPAIVQILDEVTVGVVIRSDSGPATVDMVEQHLQTVRPRCLVVDMSGGPAATPELAWAVARLLELARGRGFSVALVSPGSEVVRAIRPGRDLVIVATVDEALARVPGRLTPLPTIRVLRAA